MKSNRLKPSLQSQRGMTLVEVVVVIAVAGILAAATAPSVFGAIQRERRRQVANDVANVFREARNQAMSRGQVYVVMPSGNTLTTFAPQQSGREIRSCRETALAGGYGHNNVAKYDMNSRKSANMAIHAMSAGSSRICFEPNGGVTTHFSGSTMAPPAGACPDEGMVIYIADKDATGVVSAMRCDSPASSYEAVGGHVIRVGRNGEIGLRAPKNG